MKQILFGLMIFFMITGCTSQTPSPTAAPTIAPPTQASSTPIATATATPVPLNVTPELKALLDSQKAPYIVNELGEAVIDDASTPEAEQIVLEQIDHILTNDGLAQDILTGVDNDKNNYIFSKNYGWVKNIDVSLNTGEIPAAIPWEYAKNQEILNTIISQNYAKNPTISSDAPDPNYALNIGQNYVTLNFQNRNNNQAVTTIIHVGKEPFAKTKVFETASPEGQEFVILAQTRKNKTVENPNQLINMFFWMSKTRYEELKIYPADYMMNFQRLINENTVDISPVLIPPTAIGDVKIPWDGSWQQGELSDPTVSKLQERGALLSLFDEQTKNEIEPILSKSVENWSYGGTNTYDPVIMIDSIPKEFALYPLLTDLSSWVISPQK